MNELIELKKKTLTDKAQGCLKRMANDVIELSKVCHEYHEEFGYQEYVRWCREELGIAETMGRKFLSVYDKFTAKIAVTPGHYLTGIQPSVLYMLAAPSTPESARDEALELAEQGEKLTTKEAKELIEAHKKIESLNAELEKLREQLPTDDVNRRIEQLENALKVAMEKEPEVVPPDDYESLKAELAMAEKKRNDDLDALDRIHKEKIKEEVQAELGKYQKEIDAKERGIKAMNDRIERLHVTLAEMDAKTAVKEACKYIRTRLLEISIRLTDLFDDHDPTDKDLDELRKICGDMKQGCVAFEAFLEGGRGLEVVNG